MADLTPDERAVLRRRIGFRRQMGFDRLAVSFEEMGALLAIADERDRLRGQLFDAGYREAEMRAELAALREGQG